MRHFRLSLRTFLLVIALAGVVAGYAGRAVDTWQSDLREEAAFRAEVAHLGGELSGGEPGLGPPYRRWSYGIPGQRFLGRFGVTFSSSYDKGLAGETAADRNALRHLITNSSISRLSFYDSDVTAEAIASCGSAENIKSLTINLETPSKDSKWIMPFTNLQRLSIDNFNSNCVLDDTGCKFLAKHNTYAF